MKPGDKLLHPTHGEVTFLRPADDDGRSVVALWDGVEQTVTTDWLVRVEQEVKP